MQNASPVTTIGQMLFATAPVLNFARLVADLDGALAGCPARRRELSWDHEDLAFLDIDGTRIGLAHERGLGPRKIAVITVTVGHGDGPREARGLAARQGRLAQIILERISSRFAPDATLWQESAEVATPDLLDRLHEAAMHHPLAAAVVPVRPPSRRLPDTCGLPRMMGRVDATLAARKAGQPDPEPHPVLASDPLAPHLAIANDVPQVPPPDLSGLQAVREALYAGPKDMFETPTHAMRLAAHTIDATLMIVALPLGAAMMTYSLGRGANLNASARMLALGGIGVSAFQALGGLGGLMSGLV